MIGVIKSVNNVSNVQGVEKIASSGGNDGNFKALLDQAVQARNDIQAARGQGIVEELTPQMAQQFFAQILPEDEFNPKIDRLDRQGIPFGGDAPSQLGNVSDWTLAQAQQPINRPAARDPNRQAVDDPLQRPLGVSTLDGTVPGARPPRVDVTPFQFFLDKAVDFFLKVSDLERKSDLTMVDYVNGKASIEEVMVEKAKVSVAISFSTTLVNQVTQSFKEIQGMQI